MKKILKDLLRKTGHDIVTFKTGLDPLIDIKRRIKSSSPIIFDVGGNQGQTVIKLKKAMPDSIIHSFEPSPSTFLKLKENTKKIADVFLWNCGLGSVRSTMQLNENEFNDMSSFLELGEMGWGKIERQVEVNIYKVDEFLHQQKIQFIDLLKIDTQGFEIEVLKGAVNAFKSNQVGLLYLEANFQPIYNGLPSFTELIEFCISSGFDIVAIYPAQYRNDRAAWTDILFINRLYSVK